MGQAIKALVLLALLLGIYFWFRRVWTVLKERYEAVILADRQRRDVRNTADRTQPEVFAAVLERSENIYQQAQIMYHDALRQPLNVLPAAVMGFHPLSDNEDDVDN